MKRLAFITLFCATVAFASADTLTWTNTSTLPMPVRDNAVVAYNGYVYSVGGRGTTEAASSIHAISDVYYAMINSDGSIGAWTPTTSLPANRAVEGAYAYNGRMYVWGGWDETYATLNTCYYATINGDGSLGTWTTSGVMIPDGAGQTQMDSFGRGVLGFGKFIYVVGGERNDGTYSNEVYYSEIQASGDYGAWQTTTALPIPSGDWFHGVATMAGSTANYIYLIGGNHGGTSETQLYRNTINTDGSLGATWDQIGDLPLGIYEHAIAVSDKAVYSIGGLSGATPQDGVVKLAFIPETGALYSFPGTSLPEARARVAAVGYKINGSEYLLVVGGGGYYASDPLFDTCVYAEIPVILASDSWELYE